MLERSDIGPLLIGGTVISFVLVIMGGAFYGLRARQTRRRRESMANITVPDPDSVPGNSPEPPVS